MVVSPLGASRGIMKWPWNPLWGPGEISPGPEISEKRFHKVFEGHNPQRPPLDTLHDPERSMINPKNLERDHGRGLGCETWNIPIEHFLDRLPPK